MTETPAGIRVDVPINAILQQLGLIEVTTTVGSDVQLQSTAMVTPLAAVQRGFLSSTSVTGLNDSQAVTLQARGYGFESRWLPS